MNRSRRLMSRFVLCGATFCVGLALMVLVAGVGIRLRCPGWLVDGAVALLLAFTVLGLKAIRGRPDDTGKDDTPPQTKRKAWLVWTGRLLAVLGLYCAANAVRVCVGDYVTPGGRPAVPATRGRARRSVYSGTAYDICMQGNRLLKAGKPAEAFAAFAHVIEANPRYWLAYYCWGRGLKQTGRPAEACGKYAKALKVWEAYGNRDKRTDLARIRWAWGDALADLEEFAEACEKYAESAELGAGLLINYRDWGIALARLGQRTDAEEKWRKAIELRPQLRPQVERLRRQLLGDEPPREAKAYLERGNALAKVGRHKEACEQYAKLVELNPRDAEAYFNWAGALSRLGRFAEACGKYAKVVELNPRAVVYNNWGNALDKLGRGAEACVKYTKAVEVNPQYAMAYLNWGLTLARMGRLTEACEKLARAAEIDPRYVTAYYNWGVALARLGRHAEACEKLAKAVEIAPRFAEAYTKWGVALAHTGQRAEAEEKWSKAIELDPKLKPQIEEMRKEILGKE